MTFLCGLVCLFVTPWLLRETHRECIQGVAASVPRTAGYADRPDVTLITGASAGIGLATLESLLEQTDGTIYVAVRNREKMKNLIDSRFRAHNTRIHILDLNLLSMDSVRKFQFEFVGHLAEHVPKIGRLSLILNAGGSRSEFCLIDDMESTMVGNYFGHFSIAISTLNFLQRQPKDYLKELRVTNVSSSTFQSVRKETVFQQMNCENYTSYFLVHSYSAIRQYAVSKLAQVYFAIGLGTLLAEVDLPFSTSVNALHPGLVNSDWVYNNYGRILQWIVRSARLFMNCFFKTPKCGAQTQLYVACHPGLKGISGKFFTDTDLEINLSSFRESMPNILRFFQWSESMCECELGLDHRQKEYK